MQLTRNTRINLWRDVVPPDFVSLIAHGVLWKRPRDVVLEVLDGHRAQIVKLVRDFVQATHGRCVGRHVAEDTRDFVKNLEREKVGWLKTGFRLFGPEVQPFIGACVTYVPRKEANDFPVDIFAKGHVQQ